MNKPFVFISYSSIDYEYANKVYQALTQNGINCWIATKDIHGGQNFSEKIMDAIAECKVFCLLLSENSDKSPHVGSELTKAFSLRKTIIPFRLHPFTLSKGNDYYFQRVQWIDAFENFDAAIEELITQIKIALNEEEPTIEEETPSVSSPITPLQNYLKRAWLYLEDGNFIFANAFAEHALNVDAACAEAYLIKLLCDYFVKAVSGLANIPFEENGNYKKILKFASAELQEELATLITQRKQREQEKQEALAKQERAKREEEERLAQEKREERIRNIPLLEKRRREIQPFQGRIAAGMNHSVYVKNDGTVFAVGDNEDGECRVASWKNIVAVSAGNFHTLGLKNDGTVVAVGDNCDKQCKVGGWKNIVAIDGGNYYSLGLKANGTVVALGDDEGYGFCQVSAWQDIVAVACGSYHSLGLKKDSAVVAVGSKQQGKCEVSSWTDIVAISANDKYSLGLKKDGTVVAVGDNEYGQCDVSGWENIVAIAAGNYHALGLKADGTVVAAGDNEFGQSDVNEWENIVAISAGCAHSIALKADGTVLATGDNLYGQCNLSANGPTPKYNTDNMPQEQRIKVEIERRIKNLCLHCGGEFKGMFTKTCSICGKKKDY